MKTKNVPKGIKCKINTNFFLDKGFPKGGRGGGSDVWENFPNNFVFFFESVPKFNQTSATDFSYKTLIVTFLWDTLYVKKIKNCLLFRSMIRN